MTIHYYRKSFACNSSSDHSIVMMDPAPKDEFDCNRGFSEDHFTLSSSQSKIDYVLSLLWCSMNDLPDSWWELIHHDLLPSWVRTPRIVNVDSRDHIKIPKYQYSKYYNLEFIKDFVDSICISPNIVILGGSDHGDEGKHPLYVENLPIPPAEKIRLFLRGINHTPGDLFARKDDETDHWLLFDDGTGEKARVSFDSREPTRIKPSYPELIDLKITDYCEKNCPFCYQSSTTEGKHADFGSIVPLVYEMKENLFVPEVVLGGGEPTRHPRFLEILEKFREEGIIPNFTTSDMDWMDYPTEIINACGTFAYSYQGIEDLKRFKDKLLNIQFNKEDIYRSSPTLQFVLGTFDFEKEFPKIMDICGYIIDKFMFLSYKRVGRGTTYRPYDYSNWLSVLNEHLLPYTYFGVDTPLAKEFEKELLDFGVDSRMFEVEDGTGSMYVDAVTNKYGVTSYDGELYCLNNSLKSAWEHVRKGQ